MQFLCFFGLFLSALVTAVTAVATTDPIPLLINPVGINNCNDSKLDSNSIERCNICEAGFTKSYDMLTCSLGSISGCIATSEWGCLECSCGLVLNNAMTACQSQIIEGCLRLDSAGTGCLQPKLGYTVSYKLTGSTYTYLAIIVDTGTYCGWRLNGSTSACSKCQPGFFLEATGNSCKKLSQKLQNEHAFYLASNVLTTPSTAIQFIPGWETWVGKTNAGGYPTLITNCKTYDTTDQYLNRKLCAVCMPGYIRTQSQSSCVVGHPLCAFADDITHVCISCVHPEAYWFDATTSTCKPRNSMFDHASTRNPSADIILTCSTSGYILVGTVCTRIPNCVTSNGLTACTLCDNNFYIYGSASDKCGIYLPNCAVMAGTSSNSVSSHTCTTCSSGYYLFSSACYLMPNNCATMNTAPALQINHVCLTCSAGYHLLGNICFKDIDYCVTHFSTGIDNGCQTCQTMYYPSSSNNGYLCILHPYEFQLKCKQTDGQGSCLQCMPLQYTPDCLDIPNSSLCLISNGVSTACTKCLPNAYLVNSICLKAPSTCRRTDGLSICMQCISTYYINASNWCSPIPNCKTSKGVANTCIECLPSFTLTTSGCLAPPTGCSIPLVSGATLICKQCKLGYKLVAGVCSVIPNCIASTGQDSFCIQCANYYQLSSSKLVCSTYDPNPALDPPTFCTVFFLQTVATVSLPNNGLAPTIPNYGICTACEGDYVPWLKLNNVYSLATSITQTCATLTQIGIIINGCMVYHYLVGQCKTCFPNYYLVSGVCVETVNTPYCLYSPGLVDGVCSVCYEGVLYIPGTTSCQLQVPYCTTRLANGSCTACNTNFITQALSSLTICVVDPSLACSVNYEFGGAGVCLYNPYGLNCATSSGNKCLTCTAGYKLIRDPDNNPYCLSGLTVPDSLCTQYSPGGICIGCPSGYVLQQSTNNKEFRVCVTKNSACSATNSLNTLCTNCSSGYLDITYATNGCQTITNCATTAPGSGYGCDQCIIATGYSLSSDKLSCSHISNCSTSLDGIGSQCVACPALMYPSSEGVCVALTTTGCTASSGLNNRCTLCSDPYYLETTSYICKLGTVTNCIKYSPSGAPTTNSCILCSPGYYLASSSLCTKIANCLVSAGTASTTCTSCEDSYFLNAGVCSYPDPYVFFCQRFADSTGTCTQCYTPYYLSGGQCLARTNRNDNCATYTVTADTCNICNISPLGGIINTDTYSSLVNFCDSVTIFRCLSYVPNSQQCLSCTQQPDYQEGWLTTSQMFCKDIALSFCLTVSADGKTCTSCQENIYFLDSTTGLCLPICSPVGYYNAATKLCVSYTAAKVANCQTPHPSSDICKLCAVTYVFNSATSTCDSMGVANCADNGLSRGFICKKCASLYKLTRSNTCVSAGSAVANCATYVNNSSLCSLCNNGYYLDFLTLTTCTHITATNCLTHSHIEDVCLHCTDNTYTISKDGKACFTGRTTTHCIVSSTSSASSVCFLCETGYIAVSTSNTCIADSFNIPGCLSVAIVSPDTFYTCTTCKSNYSLLNRVCVPNTALSTCLVENCLTYSALSFDLAQCQTCATVASSTSQFKLIDNKCVFILSAKHILPITLLIITVILMM